MKIVFLLPIVLLFVMPFAYAQSLSDATGLINRLDVQAGGHTFEVEVVSNFDIEDFEFDGNDKRLTLYIVSGLENNLGEMIIPQSLMRGDFTFYLNDVEFFPNVNSNEIITFVTLNFVGSGNNKLDIFGTVYLDGMAEKNETTSTESSNLDDNSTGGCLIATATFGSELAPQVQQLRELRDNSLLQTQSGSVFMDSFNGFYYSFSPVVADYERENALFRETVKTVITPLILSLSILDHVDMDSEVTVLGYGISLILLNVGMYFVVPMLIVSKFYKLKKSRL